MKIPCNICGRPIHKVYTRETGKGGRDGSPKLLRGIFYCPGCKEFGELAITITKRPVDNGAFKGGPPSVARIGREGTDERY